MDSLPEEFIRKPGRDRKPGKKRRGEGEKGEEREEIEINISCRRIYQETRKRGE